MCYLGHSYLTCMWANVGLFRSSHVRQISFCLTFWCLHGLYPIHRTPPTSWDLHSLCILFERAVECALVLLMLEEASVNQFSVITYNCTVPTRRSPHTSVINICRGPPHACKWLIFFIQFFTIFRFSLFCSIRKVWQSVVHMLALIGLCNSKVQNSRYNQLPLRIQAIYIHIPVYIDSE